MDNHFKLIVDNEVAYFDDVEIAYELAQIASRRIPHVSLWEWMAGALPPRWIEIPIEIEEEVN
jgi:hypothetical protein